MTVIVNTGARTYGASCSASVLLSRCPWLRRQVFTTLDAYFMYDWTELSYPLTIDSMSNQPTAQTPSTNRFARAALCQLSLPIALHAQCSVSSVE